MNAAASREGEPDVRVAFRPHGAGLRVHVIGHTSFEATLGYWQAILAEVRKAPVAHLLLVDDLHGPPLTVKDWHTLVDAMADRGLEGIRIAHVRPLGLQRLDFCEIFARQAGLDARVFDSESAAELWLRHGQ